MLKGLLALALVPAIGLVAVAVGEHHDPGFPIRESRIAIHSAVSVGDLPDVLGAAADVNAAVDAYLAALEADRLAVLAYLEAIRPRIPVDWARWERLHVCEQRDSWYANGHNPADGAGQTFQGGLGMSTVAWQMAVSAAQARGVTLPASALQASPEEQMTGAQAFYDAHGWAWACKV